MTKREASLWLGALAIACVVAWLMVACASFPHPPPPPIAPTTQLLPPSLPPLPWTQLLSPPLLPPVAKLSPPRQERITLAWDNQAVPDPDLLETGLIATTNLTHWTEVALLPYDTSIIVTLTDRPPAEFYRAFNRLKPLR